MMPDRDPPSYSPPTYDEFAHRQDHPIKDVPVHRQRVQQILEDLLDLEARTHPQNPSPNGKELDSILALAAAGDLVELLAGWAIDHRAGMVLNGATVLPWPGNDQEARTEANDHRHEAVGSAYLQDKAPGDPLQNRHIVAEILARAALLPNALRYDLSEGLNALNLGEARPLLSPAKNQHHKAYTVWQLRLRAIEHVYFLWGIGETQYAAFNQVADAYSRSSHTLKTWNNRSWGLTKYFGDAAVQVARDTAKHSGQRVRRLQLTIPKSDYNNGIIESLLRSYGPQALSLNARAFQMAERKHPPQ